AVPACSSTSAPGPPEPAPAEAPADAPAGPPLFEDVTASSGVAFTYRNGEDTADHLSILESLGGGVGLIDFDGDGLLDLFIVGGGDYEKSDAELGRRPRRPDELERLLRTTDRSCKILGRPCKLYKNLGNWKFKDVTKEVLKLDGDWF